jgi:hypothetical protein
MGCYFENYLNYQENVLSFSKEKVNKFFNAYQSIKDMLKWVKQTKIGKIEAYLISKKSVENFINILLNSGVLEKICKKKNILEEEEKNLKNEFEKYNLEKNVKILTFENNKNNNDDNEFIIVDEEFFESMDIKKDDYSNKKVEIIIDNINSFFRIKNNNRNIFFKENNYGFYRFCSKEETIDIITCIKYNNFNSSSTVRKYYSGFNARTIMFRGSNEPYDGLSLKIGNMVDTQNTL